MPKPVPALTAALLALALAGCASATTSDEEPTAAASSPAAAAAQPEQDATPEDEQDATPEEEQSGEQPADSGNWIDQEQYDADPSAYHDAGKVVLFFNASWCPTCKEAASNLAADGVPAGLTVVDVDYDDSTDLKREYGVTVQHTFVQVDESGAELATFTGATSGEQIADKTR